MRVKQTCILRGGRNFIKIGDIGNPKMLAGDNAKVGDKNVMYIQNRHTIIALL